jgi:hypothetical protein
MANELSAPRRAAVDAALERNRQLMAAGGRGRLIFALDATASRQPTWNMAIELQSQMFREAAKLGGLQIQLAYFRGDEFRASDWTSSANALGAKMRTISCKAGATQWGRALGHARQEHRKKPISAVIVIGDCCEEQPEALYDVAAELGVPIFAFQEGADPTAEQVFCRLADLTKGVYAKFDSGSAGQLAGWLRSVAAYAVGGLKALAGRKDAESVKLLQQLKK